MEAWLDHAEGRSPRAAYPTFRDGLAAQRIIDRLRDSSSRESSEGADG